MSSGPGLESLVDQTISVITNDGRNIVEGVQQLVLGLYIIRGDNISIVGELDADLDSTVDWSNMKAYPLKPVIH
ncbi:hypothetical protein PRUPE_5G245700 [Prunus persica]|uniref:U6 snRNA-associated Sm-like protein LSm8 n=1 Tax=Prunus persica TaxID=3760 RepID=A0A251PDC6_PRUPE|nr:hypothetical protein PRUPE_5G245700 [Prunus persica]